MSDELSPLEQDSNPLVKASNPDVGRRLSIGISPFPALPSTVLLPISFPSRELALALIDAYFIYVYNATLLFHKHSLVSDYLAGKIPDYVALSIFALAAMYVIP